MVSQSCLKKGLTNWSEGIVSKNGLAITNDVLYDLPCDWFPGRPPPPPYLKENVHDGMTGGTPIDSVFANYAASHSCTLLRYDWAQSQGFDYVALVVHIECSRYCDAIRVAVPPCALKATGKKKLEL